MSRLQTGHRDFALTMRKTLNFLTASRDRWLADCPGAPLPEQASYWKHKENRENKWTVRIVDDHLLRNKMRVHSPQVCEFPLHLES